MEFAVEMLGITKTYPGNHFLANDTVDLTLRKGEILCLAGENGAGKTTLMKILYGMEKADAGSIRVMGKDVRIASPLDANKLGIGMAHQHFMLVDGFTVAQNVVMGIEPTRFGCLYDQQQAVKRVEEVIRRHQFSIEAGKPVKSLTVGQKQQAEIVKMLYRDVDILILDEPTAVLTAQETDHLFHTLRSLAKDGRSLILITHKLHEIKEISDRVAIMRQGKMVGVFETSQVDELELSRLMMGQRAALHISHGAMPKDRQAIIRFKEVSVTRHGQQQPLLNRVSFTAQSSEILGFAGVAGNGLGVLEAVLGGFLPVSSGHIYHREKEITNQSQRQLRSHGLAYVPADRLRVGSALEASVQENLIIAARASFSRYTILQKKRMTEHTRRLLDKYSVKGAPGMPIGTLSGGNIQKVILAREMEQYRDYIVLSEPTWGLDIASSQYVYTRMAALRDQGAAVILISSNLDEILALSDRIIVFYQGSMVAFLQGDEARSVSKQELGAYMLGLTCQQEVLHG
ncbi:MAG: ABC transporter ATP-binding protein [Sphaerochaetaceae bacterium]